MIRDFKGFSPQVSSQAFVAETAVICGRVRIAAESSIWYGAVLRGDVGDIEIGEKCSIQDNCTIHCGIETPTILGNSVTVGHNAVLHSCQIEDNCLIGMSAVVLDGARIGRGSIVGAGCLVPENKEIPPHSLVVGVPAKVIKTLTAAKEKELQQHALSYVSLMEDYR